MSKISNWSAQFVLGRTYSFVGELAVVKMTKRNSDKSVDDATSARSTIKIHCIGSNRCNVMFEMSMLKTDSDLALQLVFGNTSAANTA